MPLPRRVFFKPLEPLMGAGASCLQLDVTASQTEFDIKIEMAEAMFALIVVLVINAGYAEVRLVEDCAALESRLFATSVPMNGSQEFFQRQYDINIFGTIKLTCSILPIFRRRRAYGPSLFDQVCSTSAA